MDIDNDLIYKSIIWIKHPSNKKYFYAYHNSGLLLLRLNNFPDEPLFTLIKQLDISDIDDTPENWFIPFE